VVWIWFNSFDEFLYDVMSMTQNKDLFP
jgi:hypothetical protein